MSSGSAENMSSGSADVMSPSSLTRAAAADDDDERKRVRRDESKRPGGERERARRTRTADGIAETPPVGLAGLWGKSGNAEWC
jgi:hypothetical protein